MSELKPCPFCGGRAEIYPMGFGSGIIKCLDCGVEWTIRIDDETEAIENMEQEDL